MDSRQLFNPYVTNWLCGSGVRHEPCTFRNDSPALFEGKQKIEGDRLMSKVSRIIAVVMMAGFVAGCAATTTVWKKNNIKKAQMEKDLKICSEKAGLLFEKTGYKGSPVAISSKTSYASYMGEPFEKCMMRIGYKNKQRAENE